MQCRLCVIEIIKDGHVNTYIGILELFRSSHPEVFLEKDFLKIWSKFTRKHTWRSMISIKLLCNFIEITLRHGCSPVDLMHIFKTFFPKNTSGGLLLYFCNDTHRERIYWNRSLVAFDLLPIFTQLIKFYKFPCHISKRTCLKKVIHQMHRKWMVVLFSNFYCKIWVKANQKEDRFF